ncbi:MAG: BrnT family toxin [Nitrospirota bacterium]
MSRSFRNRFEWDPEKARQNVKKHGIAFERAATIFLDPNALSEFDEEHSRNEDRWVTLGLDVAGTLLVVCHTYHAETESSARIRIISARKASAKETTQYRGN